jgi:type II secretory pathway component PulK
VSVTVSTNQRGVALITVLVVVALLTITVTEFTYSVQLDAFRAQNARHSLQASLLARSGINLAEGFLMLDDDPKYDAFTEEWYQQMLEFCDGLPIGESMAIRCRPKDESGKVNINLTHPPGNRPVALRTDDSQQITADTVLRDAVRCFFMNLFSDADVQGTPINQALVDYWSQEPVELPDGQKRGPPDFNSLEDFGAQFGLTAQQIRSLRPFLTAQKRNVLPTINVNTAPAQVLSAVLNTEEEGCPANEIVDQIMERRGIDGEGFKNRGELTSIISGAENANAKKGLLGVTSNLWRLEASGVANYDPERPDSGIGQTLSVLVSRKPDNQHRNPETGQPGWTLRAVDWQKEGGARLFWEQPQESDEQDSEEPTEEDRLGD